jgi:hypothetical protein
MEEDDSTPLEGEEILGQIPAELPTQGNSDADTPPAETPAEETPIEEIPPQVDDEPVSVVFESTQDQLTLKEDKLALEHVVIMFDKSELAENKDDTTPEVVEMQIEPDAQASQIDAPVESVKEADDKAAAAAQLELEAEFELKLKVQMQDAIDRAVTSALAAAAQADVEAKAALEREAAEKQETEDEARMAAILNEHKIHSHEHFVSELTGRAATFACIFDTTIGESILRVGNGKMKCNLYSITKSLSALVIVDDLLRNNLPTGMGSLDDDIGDLMEVFFCERHLVGDNKPPHLSEFEGLTLAMLMNHVSGIDDIPLAADKIIKIIVEEKNTQNIIGRFLNHYSPKAGFKYSPVMGYAMVGAIYEILKEGGTYIKDECASRFLGEIWPKNSWHWREDDGEDICRHSFAFSEVFTTGENMVNLGILLLNKHRRILEYILDDTKPYPHYIKHAHSGGASSYSNDQSHANPLREDESKSIEYAYSEGWWILRRSKTRRYVVAVGWLGQYLMIGVDDGIVAVRQHELGKVAPDEDVRAQARLKKNVIVPNYHESFPAHVLSFLDSLIVPGGGWPEQVIKPGVFNRDKFRKWMDEQKK